MGLNLSFPLFTGGEKLAERQRAVKELSRIETERRSVRERIEQRVRSALHIAGASYAAIQQARLAAEAARKSLEVVLFRIHIHRDWYRLLIYWMPKMLRWSPIRLLPMPFTIS